MTIPIYTSLVGEFLSKMDAMTLAFLADNYQSLATYMATPVALMSTLYIVLMGYFILAGTIKTSTSAFLKMALTIGFVNMFALNWLYFSDFFVGIFLTATSEIGNVIANSHFFQFPHIVSTGSGINDALQTVLTECVDVGVKIMGYGGYTNWMPLLIGIIFMVGGALIVALALIEISVVKFFICLLLSSAPLFIAFALFDATKPAFKTWLSLIAGFSFALIFTGMSIGMAMHWMHWSVGGLYETGEFNLKSYSSIPLIFSIILSAGALIAVIPLARQLGSGIGGGSTAGTAARHGMNAAQKAYQSFKNRKGGTQ